jgi:tRNA (cmo5U34)-methyltransferase
MTQGERIHGAAPAVDYDYLIGDIVPGQSLLLETILDYLPDNPRQVLELGCGTGILTEMILGRFPGAEVTGIDLSPDMLRIASGKHALRDVKFIEGDLRDAWPPGPYDAVVTSLCIHHVSPGDRAGVVRRARDVLFPGGRFVCGDVFRGETDWEERILTANWLRGMHHAGVPDEVISGMAAARKERMPELRPVSWFRERLTDAGFSRVMVPFTAGFVGLVVGFREE